MLMRKITCQTLEHAIFLATPTKSQSVVEVEICIALRQKGKDNIDESAVPSEDAKVRTIRYSFGAFVIRDGMPGLLILIKELVSECSHKT